LSQRLGCETILAKITLHSRHQVRFFNHVFYKVSLNATSSSLCEIFHLMEQLLFFMQSNLSHFINNSSINTAWNYIKNSASSMG